MSCASSLTHTCTLHALNTTDRGDVRKMSNVEALTFYVGPNVGCSWCSYGEVQATERGAVKPAPLAQYLVHTARGPRELCSSHAQRAHHERRSRRVSVVA